MTKSLRTYQESYAYHSLLFREIYRKKSVAACEAAIRDIKATLELHVEPSVYGAKLWAELDAARDRLMAYRNPSNRALRLSVNS